MTIYKTYLHSILETYELFQFEISGNEDKDELPLNILPILLYFFNDDKDE